MHFAGCLTRALWDRVRRYSNASQGVAPIHLQLRGFSYAVGTRLGILALSAAPVCNSAGEHEVQTMPIRRAGASRR
jgi:hypothetical protein